jgi:hypothetical protein
MITQVPDASFEMTMIFLVSCVFFNLLVESLQKIARRQLKIA